MSLRWSWLAMPYLVCAAAIASVAIAAALVRGDRVLRLGMVGAAITALPWALSYAGAACTTDPAVAYRILRLGQGPIAFVGPNFLLVLLGISGQLERYRWVARIAGFTGAILLVLCWSTTWTVPGVQRIPSGMFYIVPGPLTGIHVSMLVICLVVGIVIVRRATPVGERRRTVRMFIGVLGLSAFGALDALLLYQIWGFYPIAWLPAMIAAFVSTYLIVRTDFIRPQGPDRAVGNELAVTAIAFSTLAVLAALLGPSPAIVVGGALAWAVALAIAWSTARAQPVQVAAERELEQFVARVATLDDEPKVADRLAALWSTAIPQFAVTTLWWRDGTSFRDASSARWEIHDDVARWFVRYPEPLALADLGTMKVGPIRDKLEQLALHGRTSTAAAAAVLVPLVDRDELIGLVEANHSLALRDAERILLADAARAAARALTFVALSRTAARERETAREVEVADALRLQASASRDAELGRWAVAAEYRTAPRTTGAGWSAIELADGRLALLVTEAQAHGVAGALATAALTGAFAAATAAHAASAPRASRDTPDPAASSPAAAPLTLDALIVALRASSEGVLRGGQPVAAFLAILDAAAGTIEFTCAGHPGGYLVGPIALVEESLPVGSRKQARPNATRLAGGTREPGASMRGAVRQVATLPPDTLVVVASTGLRGTDDERWESKLRESAYASGRLARVLVDQAGEAREDLLAVVCRVRA